MSLFTRHDPKDRDLKHMFKVGKRFSSGGYKDYVKLETIPVIGFTLLAVGMAVSHVYKLSQHPEVVWSSKKKYPWQNVKQNEYIKYVNVNEALEKKHSRSWFS